MAGVLAFLKLLRARWPAQKLYVIVDNFSPHKHPKVISWAAEHNAELVFLPAYSSWLNWIESEFTALRYFALRGTDHRTHAWQGEMIDRYMRWRNARAQPKTNFAPNSVIRTWTGTRPTLHDAALGERRSQFNKVLVRSGFSSLFGGFYPPRSIRGGPTVATAWPLVLVTLLVALIVSGASLLGRYWHRGQPFGTSAARKRAVAVVTVTAIVATGLAYLVMSLSPESIGMSLGVLIPPLLFVRRLRGYGPLEDMLAAPHFWLDVATVGVAYLLDKLQLQMAVDRDNWCDLQLGKLKLDPKAPKRSLAELETAGKFLYSRLGGRGDPGQPPPERLQTAYEALQCALDGGGASPGIQGLRKRAIVAEKAFTDMLQFAYDWGHTDNGILPNAVGQGMPPPVAGPAGAARSRCR